jgi:hypothetical protein
MIVVYVDGRCRIDPISHTPECIRGTFYLNSTRTVQAEDPNTHQLTQRPVARLDDWFEEVIQYIDQNYRTLGPSDVDVVE